MRNKKLLRCIAYLSVNGRLQDMEKREERQLRYNREYAKANNIEVVNVIHRSGLGQFEVNRHFDSMVRGIRNKTYDGILIVNMALISLNVSDAYTKVGKVAEAGGHMITVDEGDLKLPLNLSGYAGRR